MIDEVDIMRELARTEAIARKTGIAIAIGHPHRDTVEALRQWIPEAQARASSWCRSARLQRSGAG